MLAMRTVNFPFSAGVESCTVDSFRYRAREVLPTMPIAIDDAL
jgi:hypothetical protein